MEEYDLIRYFKCQTTGEEEGKIRSWLLDDPDGSHKRQYLEARMIFNGMTLYAPDPDETVQPSAAAEPQR